MQVDFAAVAVAKVVAVYMTAMKAVAKVDGMDFSVADIEVLLIAEVLRID